MALLASEAAAQPSGPRSASVTFSAPVQLPGIVLPAGVYVFEQTINGSGDGAVSVWNTTSKVLVVRLHTVATKRGSAGSPVTFREIRSTPPAIAAWYLNGGVEGHEFLYTADELRGMSPAPAASLVTPVP
jgi:hypothetical protein